jgi:hypothetical protein
MKKFAKWQTKYNQMCVLFHSLHVLVRSDSQMLSWPNSPLLVMLQFVDSSVLSGDEPDPSEHEARETPLHHLADLAYPSDYSTHQNQLILAKQLIEHGANVDALSRPHFKTPMHKACHWANVTNLDFVELLLEAGADPNVRDSLGLTPLMYTIPDAPGAAKFLLKWPNPTDASITGRYGQAFLARVRKAVFHFANEIARPDNPEQVQHQFMLQQWRDIEEILMEWGAHSAEIPALL